MASDVRINHHTITLGAITLAMWYAGAAQQNGGAYLLAFLTASIALVSWLHAKANLRALRLDAGTIPSSTQGGTVTLPLVLSIGQGPVPCGLEITAEGAAEPVFVESLTPGHPANISLRVPAGQAGRHVDRRVIVRSRYPLGFFTAEKVFILPRASLVHPRPAGHLPMPAIVQDGMGGRASLQASKPQAGAGDDFAGVREWQPGDSLRHVDWKAVARERPMTVKLWTGESKGHVWLDWTQCPLPDDQRAAQFALWMDQAETRGLRYGLRLPNTIVAPGSGLQQHRRCLDALARLQPSSEALDKGALIRRRIKTPTLESSTSVPGRPGHLLAIAMAFAALPMAGNVPVGGLIVFYLSLTIQWLRQRRRLAPMGQLWRLTVVIMGVFGTWIQAGTLFGLEPGVSILLAVTGGKILEARNAHDLQLVAILGWFLCLCDLALDQALGRSLYVFLVFLMVTMALVRLRRGSPGFKVPARTSAVLLAQALPLVLLLFPFFPRGSNDMVMHWARHFGHQTGISSNLDPGSVAEIAQSPARAFWAAFPESQVPDVSDRYWRCVVLWQCEGLRWKRGTRPAVPEAAERSYDGEIRQTITLDPHGGHWLPALDLPTHVMSNVNEHELIAADDLLYSATPVNSVRRYDVGSRPRAAGRPGSLPAETRRRATAVPAGLSSAVQTLVASFKSGKTADSQIADAALNYYRTKGFRYTLQPDKYGENALDEFLFERRAGFCEHYAASFATLMRACGIPARVVIGYFGGDYSERWGHYIVHQSDAHAWCELWYEGKGWTRVDPTAALAPGRLTSDLRTYLEGGLDSAFARNRNTWWGRAFNETQLFWDNINYQWYSRVVQFDEDDQSSLWNSLNLGRFSLRALLIGAGVLFIMPLLLVWLWLRRTPPHPDPLVRTWQTFCAKLAKAGVVRLPNEAPATFARRAARSLPDAAAQIEDIGKWYVDLRYAESPSMSATFKQGVRALRVRPRPVKR